MTTKYNIAVAMSGGVDSSVTAALLKEQGHQVTGITLLLTNESRPIMTSDGKQTSAVDDARQVCDILGISHHVVDLREKFQSHVVQPFLRQYAAGLTPNPCVFCNRHIKFGAFREVAAQLGCRHIATGHYARIITDEAGHHRLSRAVDIKKDQSYMLYQLTQEALDTIHFPLGDYTKPQVRELAKKFSLPVAQKKESQEICFIPDDDYHAFIKAHNPGCLKPGEIIHENGQVLGHHEGVSLYTIGQRKGLGIAYSEPLFVKALDVKNRRVIVGGADSVFSKNLTAENINWITDTPPTAPMKVMAKIRYGHLGSPATVVPLPENRASVVFDSPVRAVTPGQSVVFYDGDTVLGGGIIC